MISIQKFTFNSFQTNTFVLFDETGECAIIDAACEADDEKRALAEFIGMHHLKPVRLIYTHCHVDHTLGNTFVTERYHLEPEVHPEGKIFWELAREFSSVFNVSFDKPLAPKKFLNDGDTVRFGHSVLEVLYTPGHAGGSICLWNKEQKFVLTGDVLFYGSIGRTDMPTGNFDLLLKSITTKLYTMDDDTVVYPGHGPETTIGFEKHNNPFIAV
jgi:glyoxylase-like metal-dependent hydrolase (beta-lactamase superfamily II)